MPRKKFTEAQIASVLRKIAGSACFFIAFAKSCETYAPFVRFDPRFAPTPRRDKHNCTCPQNAAFSRALGYSAPTTCSMVMARTIW